MPRFVVAAAIGIAFALLAMGQLNELHRGMHVSGDPAYVTPHLDHVFHLGPDEAQSEDVLRVWRDYREATENVDGTHPTATPFEVARWFVAIDTFVLVPLYCLGLIALLLVARDRIEGWEARGLGEKGQEMGIEREPLLHLHRWATTLAIAFIVVAAVADLLENVGYWTLAKYGAANAPPYTDSAFAWRSWFLWVAASLKWLFAIAALLLAAGVLWEFVQEWFEERRRRAARRRDDGEEELSDWAVVRARLALIGVPVFLVAVFGAALIGHEQLADVMRRWNLRQFVVTVAVAVVFALLTWLVTRRLLVRGQWSPSWAARPEGRARARKILFWGVVGAAAVQLVLHVATRGGEQRWGWGLAIPALVLCVIAVLGLFVHVDTEPEGARPFEPRTSDDPVLPRLLAAATLVLLSFGIFHALFAYVVYDRAWTRWAVVPFTAAAVGALVWRLLVPRRAGLWGAALGATLALIALGVREPHESDASIVLISALILPFTAWRLFDDLKGPPPEPEVSRRLTTVIAVAIPVVAAGIIFWPIDVGETVGVVAVLAAFLVAVAGIAGALTWAARAIPVPKALVALHFRRFPLLSLIVFWFLVAGLTEGGGYHDVRVERTDVAAKAPNLAQAFECWLVKNNLVAAGCERTERVTELRGGAVPLLFVASTGGGIRAAYWTALVLDCAFEVRIAEGAGSEELVDERSPCDAERTANFEQSNKLLALSGISGGSVGLAAYAAHLVEKRSIRAREGTPESPWLERRLSVDGLSPTGLWWLFVEIPRVFLQFQLERDRSEILEESWERQWPDRELATGMFELWRSHQQVPLLLLNGTSVTDGCRFNGSVLNADVGGRDRSTCRSLLPFDERGGEALGEHSGINATSALPATRDLADYVCGTNDTPLSSAAFLSGRFPFVNPSGRVESVCPRTEGEVTYVVDGGYLDTSGASPLLELSQQLVPKIERWNRSRRGERCIVPFFIQVDNGFEDSGSDPAPRRPLELTLPLQTVFATRIARAAQARTNSALVFNTTFPGVRLGVTGRVTDRYAHFVNQAHPGPRAPLGWTQSRASEGELRGQLRQQKNIEALREVRGWMHAAATGRLRCVAQRG